MKYFKAEEEEQSLNNNQSFNRPQEKINKQSINPFLNKWIYVNPRIYFIYCLFNGFSILAGSILKIFFPITRETIGKKSLLTGIPIIRNYYFVFPILLNLIYFIWCIYIFYKNQYIKNLNENSLFVFLKNIRGTFFFTNILLLLFCYILYYFVVLNIYRNYGFKLSGHIIASILSGGMVVNLHSTYLPFIEFFKNGRNSNNFNNYIYYANTFLFYHSIYTVFWSAWIFHHVAELFFAYVISISFLFIAHVINVDELILNLIDIKPKQNSVILYKD
jgi:hypothetical protein